MSKMQSGHEPSPDELEHGAADLGHHPGDVATEAHGPDDHGETDGHDDHGHGDDALGPIDSAAWAAFAVGISTGLLVALCLAISLTLLTPAGA